MTNRLTLPDAPQSSPNGMMFAPSAARNCNAICDLVAHHAPATGRALEIASGTGQHITALATRLPNLIWQPSDVDATRRASQSAYGADAGLNNLNTPADLDALTAGWSTDWQGQDLILTVNLLHLISEPQARTLITEAAKSLAPDGVFILYGPFLRDGETTSDGDAAFHTSLQSQDAMIGYKNDWDVIDWLQSQFLELVQVLEMPANNMAFVARKP
ncbi:MAG: DUF938 domain-containing protein [Paracoccaceae bacterium]